MALRFPYAAKTFTEASGFLEREDEQALEAAFIVLQRGMRTVDPEQVADPAAREVYDELAGMMAVRPAVSADRGGALAWARALSPGQRQALREAVRFLAVWFDETESGRSAAAEDGQRRP